jgi:hypothetical protein
MQPITLNGHNAAMRLAADFVFKSIRNRQTLRHQGVLQGRLSWRPLSFERQADRASCERCEDVSRKRSRGRAGTRERSTSSFDRSQSQLFYSTLSGALCTLRRIDPAAQLRWLLNLRRPRAIAGGANHFGRNFARSFHCVQSSKQKTSLNHLRRYRLAAAAQRNSPLNLTGQRYRKLFKRPLTRHKKSRLRRGNRGFDEVGASVASTNCRRRLIPNRLR